MTCLDCEYHKNRAARWRTEAYKQAGHEIELPWVGLTDEDMKALVEQARAVPTEVPCHDYNKRLLTLAEAKLKEKNT